MRVLFQNRPKNQWLGGDQVQLEKTMAALGKLGVDCEFNDQPFFSPAVLLSDYDIVHLWNFSMLWTKYQLWCAKRQGRKVVCSMIYHATEVYVSHKEQQVMADQCDAMIFLNPGELERARRNIRIDESKVHFIPNGIDSVWVTKRKQPYSKKGYVLTVGRLDGSKGQYETALACRELGIEYLCAGELNNESYAELCRDAGAVLLGKVDHLDLIPLYDNAAVHVIASFAEIYPLCVMEAGARGLNSVVTDTCEWKDIPQVTWCRYGSAKSIANGITEALKLKKNTEFRKKLKEMTWDSVGRQVLEVYKSI